MPAAATEVRRSIMASGQPTGITLPTSDSTIDEYDRGHLCGYYAGISASNNNEPPSDNSFRNRPRGRLIMDVR